MLQLVLQSFIPLFAAFPLFTVIVEFRDRSCVRNRLPWLVFSCVFFLWHGIVARFISESDFIRPMITLGDLALLFFFTVLWIREENRKAEETLKKPFLLRGILGLILFSAVLVVSTYIIRPAIFLIPLF